MKKVYFVYILTNVSNTVLYVGVTNDLKRRLYEHKNELVEGFTKKYHVHKLIYYEMFGHIRSAIAREKQLKGFSRIKKKQIIQIENPSFEEIKI